MVVFIITPSFEVIKIRTTYDLDRLKFRRTQLTQTLVKKIAFGRLRVYNTDGLF